MYYYTMQWTQIFHRCKLIQCCVHISVTACYPMQNANAGGLFIRKCSTLSLLKRTQAKFIAKTRAAFFQRRSKVQLNMATPMHRIIARRQAWVLNKKYFTQSEYVLGGVFHTKLYFAEMVHVKCERYRLQMELKTLRCLPRLSTLFKRRASPIHLFIILILKIMLLQFGFLVWVQCYSYIYSNPVYAVVLKHKWLYLILSCHNKK